MDMYRFLRKRYVYSTFFVFCALIFFLFIVLQEGGAVSVTLIDRVNISIIGYSLQNMMFIFTNTHIVLAMTAFLIILFYNEERRSQFRKNIYPIQRNKWLVYIAKWLVCFLLYASFLVCILILCALFNFLTNTKVIDITSVDVLIYCIEVTLLNSVILYGLVFLENLSQGFVVPAITIFLLISGTIDMGIEGLVPVLSPYSISRVLTDLSMQFYTMTIFKVILLALLCILLYTIGNVMIVHKREQK